MSLSEINFSGGEVILVLALVLILVLARKLPGLAKGLGEGWKEFRKATREVSEEVAEAMELDSLAEEDEEQTGHPFLMALTFILGAACLILLLYEMAK